LISGVDAVFRKGKFLGDLSADGSIGAKGDIGAGGQFNGNGFGLNNIQYASKAGDADRAAWATNAGNANLAARATRADDADRADWATEAGLVKCQNVSGTDSGQPCKNTPPIQPSPPTPTYSEQIVSQGSIQLVGNPIDQAYYVPAVSNTNCHGPECLAHWSTAYIVNWLYAFGPSTRCMEWGGDPWCNAVGMFSDPGGAFAGGYFAKCEVAFTGDATLINRFSDGYNTHPVGLPKMIGGQPHYRWSLFLDTNEDLFTGFHGNTFPVYPSAINYRCTGYK
jgi:hypothetical protein